MPNKIDGFGWARRVLVAMSADIRGSVVAMFAVLLPVLIGAVGMTVDLSQAYLVRQRLGGAVDAAALAVASLPSDTDPAELEALAQKFLDANYPSGKIGATYDLNVAFIGDSAVIVSAYADYDTSFMRIAGIDTITVSKSATVQREVKGLEVALVLDNTGSMGTSNIDALKTASTNFINILFDKVENAEDLKIGIVPYSGSVRVGRYGLGQYPDGTSGYGDPFVVLPTGVSYTSNHEASSGWYGCIVEHHAENYDSDATAVANSKGQLWTTSATGICTGAADCRGHGWDPGSTTNDPYPDDVNDDYQGPWEIYQYGRTISYWQKCSDLGGSYSNATPSRCNSCTGGSGVNRCTTTYCFCSQSAPNRNCPWANIVPLTSDQSALLAAIQTMKHEGSTLSNIGMAWGGRVLSPEFPFQEGSAWEDENWNKAIVMMTDGETSPSGTYSAYYTASGTDVDEDAMNARLVETCDYLKASPRNVIIYTITFSHATSDVDEATKQYYKDCATSAAYYFDAPTQAELIDVFEKISGALARLHISN